MKIYRIPLDGFLCSKKNLNKINVIIVMHFVIEIKIKVKCTFSYASAISAQNMPVSQS